MLLTYIRTYSDVFSKLLKISPDKNHWIIFLRVCCTAILPCRTRIDDNTRSKPYVFITSRPTCTRSCLVENFTVPSIPKRRPRRLDYIDRRIDVLFTITYLSLVSRGEQQQQQQQSSRETTTPRATAGAE